MNAAADLLLAKARTLSDDAPVPSPCISVCRMDAAGGLCIGCFRTLDEIAAWGGLDDTKRRTAWRVLVQRAAERLG